MSPIMSSRAVQQVSRSKMFGSYRQIKRETRILSFDEHCRFLMKLKNFEKKGLPKSETARRDLHQPRVYKRTPVLEAAYTEPGRDAICPSRLTMRQPS
jgi:hypothetical protein